MDTRNIPTSTPKPGCTAKQAAITANIAAPIRSTRIFGAYHKDSRSVLISSQNGREGEGFLKAPSALKTGREGFPLQPGKVRPFLKGSSYSIPGDADIVASVVLLLFLSGPTNVSGGVIPIGVDSIKGVGRTGRISNIGIKRSEIIPFACKSNASPPVSVEILCFGVVAPRSNIRPQIMHAGRSHLVRRSSSARICPDFLVKAAA